MIRGRVGELMHRNRRSVALAIVLVVSAIGASGCGILRPTRGRWMEEAPRSGFLRDYSQLEPHDDYPAQEIYIAPDAEWSKYNAVYIESVSLWTLLCSWLRRSTWL